MLNISKISNNLNYKRPQSVKNCAPCNNNATIPNDLKNYNTSNLKAYHPSFCAKNQVSNSELPSKSVQLKTITKKLDKKSYAVLKNLDKKGVLDNNQSNDGSTVLENLYKIATEPRIQGLNDGLIIAEVIKALDNPYSITQTFGDIPDEAETEIENETGEKVPQQAKNVISSSCVAASMEFKLANLMPAEFARFAQSLSSQNYSVKKNVKVADISDGTASCLWMLRKFNTDSKFKNWDDVEINIKPDRNAIVRARVQTSYKDNNERSCIDVLIQSALLNLGSQNTYNALIDERTGEFNPDKSGLTDFEKTFVEQIVFEKPVISVVYQNIDENGYLTGYNAKPEEVKQHLLKSFENGQNVILGYTHLDENNKVDGGHEITAVAYKQDKDGKGRFICNDTDDGIDTQVEIPEDKLIPLIHHAGIAKEALNKDDVIVDSNHEIINQFQAMLKEEQK